MPHVEKQGKANPVLVERAFCMFLRQIAEAWNVDLSRHSDTALIMMVRNTFERVHGPTDEQLNRT